MSEPTKKDFAEWLLANEAKSGTPEWQAVSDAYDKATYGQVIDRGQSPDRNAGREFVRSSQLAPVAGFNSMLQGATFGFGDELLGGASVVADPFHPVEQYKKGRDFMRGVGDRFGQDYPISDLAGQLTGGVLAGGGPTKAVVKAFGPGVTLPGRVATTMGVGGTLGAASGAGAAEDVSSIPFQMVKHGAFGAAMSPAVQALGAGVVGVGNKVAGGLDKLGVTVPFFTGAGARDRALERVATSFARDETRPGLAAARLDRQGFGGEGKIVDTAGQSVRDLLDQMATLPGKTRNLTDEFMRIRKIGAPERMDVLANLANQGNRAAPTVDLLTRSQEQLAKPLYAAVDNKVVPITPQLESLFQRPAFRDAYNQARVNAADATPPVTLPTIDELMKSGPVGGLPVKVWDGIKKGFDDVIYLKKRGQQTNEAKSTIDSMRDVKNEMLTEIDRLTGGAYKQARDAFAGPAALKSAIEDGKTFWQMKPQEITETLAKLSPSEQQAFRIGAGEVLREKVGSPRGQTELINAWQDRNTREKLMAIYGDQKSYLNAVSSAKRQAQATLLGEEKLRKTQPGGNSQTARREAGTEDLNLGVWEDAANAAAATKTGNIPGLLAAVRKQSSRLATPEPVRNEIGRILTQGGQAGKDELARLAEMIKWINERNSGQAAFSSLLAAPLTRY